MSREVPVTPSRRFPSLIVRMAAAALALALMGCQLTGQGAASGSPGMDRPCPAKPSDKNPDRTQAGQARTNCSAVSTRVAGRRDAVTMGVGY
ncbi:MAG TPA: hypothetical protein VEK73_14930 [Xanthobacteraceae bacterium]|nr:hypothetical protein [Xanthobacteraceae bacterium]